MQEFKVNKVNRKGKYNERILCIDGNSFYHKKIEKKAGFFGSMMPKGILSSSAPKLKPIAQICDLGRKGEQELIIYYKDIAKDEKREFQYRCETPDTCSEILAKLKFLVGDQIQRGAGPRMQPATFQNRSAVRGYF